MDTRKELLGTGWQFPVETDDTGGIAVSVAEEDVEEAIWIILGTAKGERVMRPEFGCGIHDFVFETIDTSTLTDIRESVREALRKWEPRTEVRNVEVSAEEISLGRLLISVDYRIRQTNVEGNLVYPFYIEG
jgi:phage baseplate assembly protein W